MKSLLHSLGVLSLLLSLLSSCVVKKKYADLSAKAEKQEISFKQRNDSLQFENDSLRKIILGLKEDLRKERDRSVSAKKSDEQKKNFKTSRLSVEEECQQKALFTFNFCKFIQWPVAASKGDFIIGVIGNSVLFEKLKEVADGKMLLHRKIKVVSYNSVYKGDVHLLFIGDGQADNFATFRKKLLSKPVLFVTENNGLLEKGSHINFLVEDRKVKFIANKSLADRSGFKVSQDLMKFSE